MIRPPTPNKKAAFRVHPRTRLPALLSLGERIPWFPGCCEWKCSWGLWGGGQGKDYRHARQRQAYNPPGLLHVQTDRNKSQILCDCIWKKYEGKIFPGRRFRFHSWERWCDQSQGIEDIMRREAGAGSLCSPNLLSCQLSDVTVSEFPSAPFSMCDHFFISFFF